MYVFYPETTSCWSVLCNWTIYWVNHSSPQSILLVPQFNNVELKVSDIRYSAHLGYHNQSDVARLH